MSNANITPKFELRDVVTKYLREGNDLKGSPVVHTEAGLLIVHDEIRFTLVGPNEIRVDLMYNGREIWSDTLSSALVHVGDTLKLTGIVGVSAADAI